MKEIKNDLNIENQWSRVKEIINFEIDITTPNSFLQILTSVDTAVNGLASLTNNLKDGHLSKLNIKKQDAKLIVNLAITVAEFLMDAWNYQSEKSCH